ncbi:MiaB/RimO family radical SAM methylthiotransferase [Patescibacteria group bacterium]|nr:MiaB/RimO family radical SAM methylthiotransferase [Patescibacteria group bacterium]
MKYYIYIVGCAMNNSDAERIGSALQMIGYKKTEKEHEADLLIAVACSVRQTAIDRIYSKGQRWKKRNVKTALTGCVLDIDKKKLGERFDYIFEINNLGDFMFDLSTKKQAPKNKQIRNSKPARPAGGLETQNSGDYLNILPNYESFFRAYVPIMTGCDNFCSYCAVPYVRGREKSRPATDVVNEVQALIKNGYKEITLLGQNVNSYAQALSSKHQAASTERQKTKNKFVELIKKIDKIPGDYRVYFYSNHPKDFSDELVALLPRLNHFPPYIHLPLQSGDDEILKKMNRHYTRDSYLDLIRSIKSNVPGVAITTDIIVGYPGETRKQFLETKKVVEKVGYEMAFVAQYSPRPGTLSAKLDDNVTKDTKKKREKELMKVIEGQLTEKNKALVGKKIKVLLDGKKGSNYYGRTETYKVVEINLKLKTDNQELVIGEFYNVKVVKSGPWKLIATL